MSFDQMYDNASAGWRRFCQANIGEPLKRLGVSANAVTHAGMYISVTGTVVFCFQLIWSPAFWVGLGIAVFGASFDFVDGAVARASGTTVWGKQLDSITDRVVETAMYASLAYVLAHQGRFIAAYAAVAALGGSVLVTLIRSKAEKEGCKGDYGPGDRMMRLLALCTFVLVGHYVSWMSYTGAVWAVNALAWPTAIRRTVNFRRQLEARP